MVEVTGEKAEKAVDKFEAAADIGLLKKSVHSPPPFPGPGSAIQDSI